MTTEDALNRHFAATGIYRQGCTREDWYPGHFVEIELGGLKIPFLPILRRNGPVVLHDLHHMLTGYQPDWRGEVGVAGWELGSGGCGWHLFYWLDRVTFFLLGLVFSPVVTLQGLAKGWKSRNLYRMDPEAVLRMEIDEVRAFVRG